MADAVNNPLPIVVLISGRGSNLQSIIDSVAAGDLPVEIRAVISNRPGVQGLQRASQVGISTQVVDHSHYPDRVAFDKALQVAIDTYRPELVVLAGFMRILTPAFVHHYRGRMINIHPSLLPEFPGLNTHQRVLDAGRAVTGATIHFVTEEMDGGPAILQARVPVLAGDDAESLAARVLEQEHRMYPVVIRWYAEGRVRLDTERQVRFDDVPLKRPRLLDSEADAPC
ncbi:MAG: phosphoribosylglycinamide formyltransferase [Halobacteria archaeon]|nr:phosphoribosylglycinamide formyltransferase [Halobacteria archaeon]